MKRVYIRVDGNEIIATGHVMRCLSIAEQIRKAGAEVVFILADGRPCGLIEGKGFAVKILDTIWNDLDIETNILYDYLQTEQAEILLIDSYFVTPGYLQKIAQCTKIVYIDDLGKFLYPVNTLIRYNAFAKECEYKKPYEEAGMNVECLVGATYIPLREEFVGIPYPVRNEVRKILITTGGTDQLNIAGGLLEKVLKITELQNLEYHVIVGCFNQNKDNLYRLSQRFSNVHLHENVTNMSVWMRECDVAISAAGTTTYELCACGIPSVCLEIADNQNGAIAWEESGYMSYAGNACMDMEGCVNGCVKALVEYQDSYGLRMERSKKMQMLVDGKGAKRIADYLMRSF